MPRREDEREPAGGGTKANVTSLLERTSRTTLLPPNGDRRSAAVLAGALRPPPEDARRAITFGRGSGSAGCAALDRHPNLASYFRDPRRPRQKGGVENANGRVRRSLPRHCGPEALGRAHLRRLPGRLDGTPRRRPGYRTPREAFEEYLAGPAARPWPTPTRRTSRRNCLRNFAVGTRLRIDRRR